MTGFFQALGFLTVLPLRRHATASFGGAAVAYFPLVGALVGALLAGADVALQVFSPPLRSILVVGLWLAITGGLHFDGWVDACDALAPGLSREQARVAMRDPRAGALGVGGGIVLLVTKWTALASLANGRLVWLVLATAAGRWMAVMLLLFALPRDRRSGLGAGVAAGLGPRHALLPCAVLVGLLPLVTAGPWAAAVALVAIASGSFAGVLRWRLGELSGDACGAAVELSETCVLLFAAGMQP